MPHSLRVRLKNLQRKGELTEKDIDRIFKALEQEPTEKITNDVWKDFKKRKAMMLEPCDDDYQTDMDEAWKQAKREPCDDAISRNDMLDAVGHGTTYTSLEVQKIINVLPSVNPVPCDDVVSRQAVLDEVNKKFNEINIILENLPSVRPQEQTGHWIKKEDDTCWWYVCSECGQEPLKNRWNDDDVLSTFCPNCGAKMVEPQESEG